MNQRLVIERGDRSWSGAMQMSMRDGCYYSDNWGSGRSFCRVFGIRAFLDRLRGGAFKGMVGL